MTQHQTPAPMTPNEHYAYGVSLLKGCESLFEVDTTAAAHQAALAQAHFSAATAGACLNLAATQLPGGTEVAPGEPAPTEAVSA
ncbi:MAG TPA: hypothetical protein VOB72_08225 [Candidatus Dormibacteraeota bacterium]|nr:hypothetical protein [Candidatus Dormibacteraeota bacterium]